MPNNVRIHTEVDGNAGKELKSLRDGWDTFQRKGAEGLAIGAGITAATKGFGLLDSALSTGIDFLGDSITKASDLNETMSKAEVIFGDNAKAVEDWAGTMDKAAGQSKKAALDAASGFAGLFKTVGLSLDQSTKMSENLTQLGSDLASFFNTDVGEALDALKSGLNGESEPLRRFNVFLSETAVSAKLAEMGVQKVGGQFTEAQKATARYQLILAQTGDAQGDFARTSDGLANSQRVTAAEVENLQAEIGQELLPVVRDLSNWAKDEGVPALKGLIDVTKDLGAVLGTIPEAFQNSKDWRAKADEFAGSLSGADDAANKLGEDAPKVTKEVHRLGEKASDAAGSIDDAGDAAGQARPRIKGLGGAAQKAADDFRELQRDADKAGQAVADAAYGPEHLRLEFEKNRAELKDNQSELDKTAAKIKDLGDKGKHVPKDLQDKFRDLKIEVNEGKQAVIEDAIKLHSLGKISLHDLEAAFRRQDIRLDDLSGAAREYWIWLHRIQQIGGTINGSGGGSGHGGSGNDKGKAAGGLVPAGDWSTVGEKGMELAHARPGGGVDIFPLSGSSATPGYGGFLGGSSSGGSAKAPEASGPIVIQLMLDGRKVAEVVAPDVTKWQQDRRVFTAR